MSSIDSDTYDPEYKRQRNKDRNKIVNKILLDTAEKKSTNNTSTTIKSKHGGEYTGQKVGKFWIKTLSKGKQKPSSLNEEDKQILRGMFRSDGSGVTKTDERDYYFDSGTGTWY